MPSQHRSEQGRCQPHDRCQIWTIVVCNIIWWHWQVLIQEFLGMSPLVLFIDVVNWYQICPFYYPNLFPSEVFNIEFNLLRDCFTASHGNCMSFHTLMHKSLIFIWIPCLLIWQASYQIVHLTVLHYIVRNVFCSNNLYGSNLKPQDEPLGHHFKRRCNVHPMWLCCCIFWQTIPKWKICLSNLNTPSYVKQYFTLKEYISMFLIAII